MRYVLDWNNIRESQSVVATCTDTGMYSMDVQQRVDNTEHPTDEIVLQTGGTSADMDLSVPEDHWSSAGVSGF